MKARLCFICGVILACGLATPATSQAAPALLPNVVGDGFASFVTDEYGCKAGQFRFDPLGMTYNNKNVGGSRFTLLRSVDGSEKFTACSAEPYLTAGIPHQTTPALLDEMMGPGDAIRHSRYVTYNDKLEAELYQSASCAALTEDLRLTNVFPEAVEFHLMHGGDSEVEFETDYAGDVAGGDDPNTSYVYDNPGSAIRAVVEVFGSNILGWRGYVDPAGGVAYEANFYFGYPLTQPYNTSYRNTVGNTPAETDPNSFVDDDLDNDGVSDTVGDSAQGVATAVTLLPGESVSLRIVNRFEPAACALEPNAGGDINLVVFESGGCFGVATLDASSTTTSGGATFTWFEGDEQVGVGAMLNTSVIGLGRHDIVLRVCDDNSGSCAYDLMQINVTSPDEACMCDSSDCDGDGLSNQDEIALGTNPVDADSDDDGVLDGSEPDFDVDTDGDGDINALDPDSDGDGLLDGTELGIVTPHADTNLAVFVPDADPTTTTNPLDADSDGGGVSDGREDTNLNGAFEDGEGDPNAMADDALVDNDGDTIPDLVEGSGDTDGDGIADWDDLDSDGDTLGDADEAGDADLTTPPIDTDGDGTPDFQDDDADNDGIVDNDDNCVLVANADQADVDGDGQGDACDADANGDGFLDDVRVQGGKLGCNAGGGVPELPTLLLVVATIILVYRRRANAVR